MASFSLPRSANWGAISTLKYGVKVVSPLRGRTGRHDRSRPSSRYYRMKEVHYRFLFFEVVFFFVVEVVVLAVDFTGSLSF